MKNTLIFLTFLSLALFSCGDKTQTKSHPATMEPQEIMKLEKETTEIESLEMELNQDIQELDTLLNDLDNI